MNRITIAAVALCGLTACASPPGTLTQAPPVATEEAWLAAIADAALPTQTERAFDLVAITPDTPGLEWQGGAVKMVSWMSQESYERYYSGSTTTTPDGAPRIWVTAVPQVKTFCQGLGMTDPTPRLKQYLGLAESWSYAMFVELWVDPADLIRPCPDMEVTDSTCDVGPGPSAADVPWWADLYRTSYLPSGAPWTRLGYTYDWAADNPTHHGASEFMIKPGVTVAIASATKTAEYCAPE